MKKALLLTTISVAVLSASVSNKEIANMFMLGFYGTKATPNTKIYNDICKSGLGGVIVFKKSPIKRGAAKNFTDAKSLKSLTTGLKSCGAKPLIAVDQEGGLVQRIKLTRSYPKASVVAKSGLGSAKSIYTQMSKELKSLGVNFNLAPVADIALNPKNRVIVKWGRSYGSNYKNVISYDKAFINAMHSYNIATSLKHFPGHGSSLGDTHKGFVDVTKLWKKVELKPYMALKNSTDTVMVAHIFNKNLDATYPASLSKRVVTNLLRGKIGFNGVVISDDLQMGAIAKHYTLKQRVMSSINAGVDIMLFANQLNAKSNISIQRLTKIVRELINSGKVSEQAIKAANIRINRLKNRLY
jgi:beta-N-acetylhexosaminidase